MSCAMNSFVPISSKRLWESKSAPLHYQAFEKTVNLRLDGKSIRLDVYVEDEEGRVYDIEMQCTNSQK